MNRDTVVRAVVVLALLALLGWLSTLTEWVEVDVQLPLRGEALKNPLYATQALARGMGASVVRRHGLADMPPPQGVLVLDSRHWGLLPERAQQVRNWVRGGGQLVIPKWAMDLPSLEDFLPIDDEEVKRKPKPAECKELREPDNVAPAYAPAPAAADANAKRDYRICAALTGPVMRPAGVASLWSVQGEEGVELLRVPVGRGSVTVIGPWEMLDNTRLLREDNALLAAAALQLRPGASVWFVSDEAREPLLVWLWHSAWPAVLAGLLALALVVWRGMVRLGPSIAPAPTQRRSMTEQVLGTGQFLHKHGAAALHAAALRALCETARTRLHGFDTQPVFAQAQTLAAVTGLDEIALVQALTPARDQGKLALSRQLQILETARRRLLAPQTASSNLPKTD